MGDNCSQVDKALLFAIKKHKGQVDKAGAPYFMHPWRVGKDCLETYHDETISVAAVLHDTIEDTETTKEELLDVGFSKEVVEIVDALTMKEGISRQEYLKRIKEFEPARKVKVMDLRDNMNLSRLYNITEKDVSRWKRYVKEYEYLMGIKEEENNGQND